MPMKKSFAHDKDGDTIVFTDKYVSYRNRVLPVQYISDLRVKNKKLVVIGDTSMIIPMASHDDAIDLLGLVTERLYETYEKAIYIETKGFLDWLFT
jgi:hypothetical protein